jgi:hypothetical protein
MLLNMQNIMPSIISEMRSSLYEFYLTGSRYWGTFTEKSDWDFFVQDSKSVREYLTKRGFTNYSRYSEYAADGQCIDVFVYRPFNEPSSDDLSNQVHVQIVLDAKFKQAVQEELFRLFPRGFRDKDEASKIWLTAFTLAKYKPQQ